MVDLAYALARCGLFRGFDARRLGALAAGAQEVAVAAGAVVFHEGDPGDAMYVVLAGAVQSFTRDRDGREVVLVRLDAGEHFGEQSLLPGTTGRRSAGARAAEAARLARVPKADFQAALTVDDALRERVRALGADQVRRNLQILSSLARGLGLDDVASHRRVLADGEILFRQGDDADALYFVTVGRLAIWREDGGERRLIRSVETLAWRDADGRSRELRLAVGGDVVGLTARGVFADAHALHLFVLDGGLVGAPARARFAASGTLDLEPGAVTDDVVCHCVNLSATALRRVIAEGAPTFDRLQKATGCATVCGGCAPTVAEILGAEEWVLADVVAESREAPDVRSFELAPRDARYPDAEPGQHIVVEGVVRGLRLRRPYTLSSARRHGGRLRITVKREPQGVFSAWLFDERPTGEPLRITRPRGDHVIDLSGGPAVCLTAGIGITPALAAAQTLADEGRPARLIIHYSGRALERMAGVDALEAAVRRSNLQLIVRETVRDGRLDAPAVADLVGRVKDAEWYLCGPRGYLDTTARLLRAAGVDGERIHVETFTPVGGATAAATVQEREAARRYLLVAPQ